ncbi:FAD-dependent oxidoreductase [Klebsiella variicola]|uniref:FAD-dependent oxidoreductase n=1 Tax=Klebsiella variicola TaxID=244366 RepID=UPI0028C3F3AA|nr:FAD-dependent monooxygenase [Klebsiella variicola]
MKKVLIVGAGPVGLIIGCYLNKYGIDFDIIDKNTHSTTWSKALSVSPATIKAFHGLALAGELTARASRFSQFTPGIKTASFCILITAISPPAIPSMSVSRSRGRRRSLKRRWPRPVNW